MKFPSLQYLINAGYASLRRFPMVIFSSLLAVSIGIYLIEHTSIPTSQLVHYMNWILTAGIAIPLYFCAQIISEKFSPGIVPTSIIYGLTSILLLLIFLSLPSSDSSFNTSQPYVRYVSYNICAHLVVSFLPYFQQKSYNGFWQYNKLLFLRFLTSALYASFLFAGLALAMGALYLLFQIEFRSETYFKLFIIIAGVFNTWFFITGIHKDFTTLESDYTYPKGLKIFAQYILLPLLTLYLFILYTYGGKIMITRHWPEGIVTYLIICISVLGIFTCLLLYPYANSNENKWISWMNKAYYYLLGPLLILLFAAIFMRINDYGLTINRYIILALGIWLLILCLFTYWKGTNIKFIPASLAAVIFLSSWGPWGMYAISERSQINRLKDIFSETGILKNGKIQKQSKLTQGITNYDYSVKMPDYANNNLLNDSLHSEVLDIMEYLDNHHGFAGIQKWYDQNIDSFNQKEVILNKSNGRYFDERKAYLMAAGIDDSYNYAIASADTTSAAPVQMLNISNADLNAEVIDAKQYDYIIAFNSYEADLEIDQVMKSFTIHDKTGQMSYMKNHLISIAYQGQNAQFGLSDMLNKCKKSNPPKNTGINWPEDSLSITAETLDYQYRLQINHISFYADSDSSFIINHMDGSLFLRKR